MSSEIDNRINARHLVITGGILTVLLGLCSWLVIGAVNRVNNDINKLDERVEKLGDKFDSKMEKMEEVTRLVVKHDGEIRSTAKDLERMERKVEELNP